jgi:transcription termination/antitermination protein NusG
MLTQVSQGGVLVPAPQSGPWRVVHTRSRQEKALAELLAARGIHHYLPLVKRVRYYGKRKQCVQMPLFPGYLFLRGNLEEAYLADRTDRVVQVLPVCDQSAMEADLAAIRFALERNGGLEPARFPEVGTWVEVAAGPFRGLRGVVDRGVQDDRLVLGVRMLGRAADLEIDRTLLRPIE